MCRLHLVEVSSHHPKGRGTAKDVVDGVSRIFKYLAFEPAKENAESPSGVKIRRALS